MSDSGDSFGWQVSVDNPWHTAFEVELVVSLFDATGATMATSSSTLRLAADRRLEVDGTGALPASPRPRRWRIEYWSRPVPPPGRQSIRSP